MKAHEEENAMKQEHQGNNIVFFVDKEQFKTEKTELTVREILVDFAEEAPDETTLVRQRGNNLEKLVDLSMIISLENGMRFIVYHNGATTVS